MPSIVEMLNENPECLPRWLHSRPTSFNRTDFFGSRTVYYPGSGDDGQPVSFCSRSHAAHSFIYVDYLMPKNNPGDYDFLGYDIDNIVELDEVDLGGPDGWMNVNPEDCTDPIEPYASFLVLRRQDSKDESHGPKRLAILFVGADGFDTFEALYCQNDGIPTPAPYMIVAQDHAFGHNHDNFSQGEKLQRLASENEKEPQFLLVGVGNNTIPWENYIDAGADPEHGGANNTIRKLYIHTPR